MKKSEILLIAGLFVASNLDAHSTILSLASGNVEANPVFASLYASDPVLFQAVRGFLVPIILSSIAFYVRRFVRFAVYLLAIPISVWLLAALWNYLRAFAS